MRISTKEASRQLGIPIPELQWQMKTGQLPIGTVRVGEPTRYYPNGKTSYYIQQELVDAYLRGDTEIQKRRLEELEKKINEFNSALAKMQEATA